MLISKKSQAGFRILPKPSARRQEDLKVSQSEANIHQTIYQAMHPTLSATPHFTCLHFPCTGAVQTSVNFLEQRLSARQRLGTYMPGPEKRWRLFPVGERRTAAPAPRPRHGVRAAAAYIPPGFSAPSRYCRRRRTRFASHAPAPAKKALGPRLFGATAAAGATEAPVRVCGGKDPVASSVLCCAPNGAGSLARASLRGRSLVGVGGELKTLLLWKAPVARKGETRLGIGRRFFPASSSGGLGVVTPVELQSYPP